MYELASFYGRPLGRPEPQHRRTFDMMVVSRRIGVGPDQVTERLRDPSSLATDLPAGALLSVGPMVPGRGPAGTTWRAGADLRGAGLRRIAPVKLRVEVTSWSASSSEVRISPASRRARHWGARRLDRYFTLVHAAADHLRRSLAVPEPAPPPAVEPTPARPRPIDRARSTASHQHGRSRHFTTADHDTQRRPRAIAAAPR